MKTRNNTSKVCRTRALLDSGSNRSFCTEQLKLRLNANGVPTDVILDTLGGQDRRSTSEVDLEVKGACMKWSRALNMHRVIVRPKLPEALNEAVTTREDVRSWNHLKSLDIPSSLGKDDSVELLVGLDNPQAFKPLEVRTASDGAPFAVSQKRN